jgi:LacI family transcriptional regulator
LLNQSVEPLEGNGDSGTERTGARAGRIGPAQGAAGRHHSLRIDNREGARLAVEHLLGLGHRAIAFIGGPRGNSDAAERLLGYRHALAAGGVPQEGRIELDGDFDEESGLRAGAAIALLQPRPTAVFAANDAMAIGCLAALRERALRVPEDVSLVGFDDIPMARYLTPALTTVQVPIADLGRQALACLLRGVGQGTGGAATHAVIAPTLAIRASAAAAASERPTANRRKRRTSS